MFRTVRKKDGFGTTTPDLRPVVERLQRALKRAGFPVVLDGLFGEMTDKQTRAFQRSRQLQVDGIAGPTTWRALREFLRPSELGIADITVVQGLKNFRGDLNWIHEREGHAGKPYWPGGRSGVTLDPGFDLGFQSPARTRQLYAHALSPLQRDAAVRVIGIRGTPAADVLRSDRKLMTIRIGHKDALRVMPHIAVRYWIDICRRFSAVSDDDTPPSVQTALLSLAYNRGAGNKALEALKLPMERHDWRSVAEHIGNMQQDHELPGIRRRRRMEAELIQEELTF